MLHRPVGGFVSFITLSQDKYFVKINLKFNLLSLDIEVWVQAIKLVFMDDENVVHI